MAATLVSVNHEALNLVTQSEIIGLQYPVHNLRECA